MWKCEVVTIGNLYTLPDFPQGASTIKAAVLSDFHWDTFNPQSKAYISKLKTIFSSVPRNSDGKRLAFLAGDYTDDLEHSISFMSALGEHHKDIDFFVIYGNHDLYRVCNGTRQSVDSAVERTRRELANFRNVHVLEHTAETFVVNGKTLLIGGTVGWWDTKFAAQNPEHAQSMKQAFMKSTGFNEVATQRFISESSCVIRDSKTALADQMSGNVDAVVYLSHTLSEPSLVGQGLHPETLSKIGLKSSKELTLSQATMGHNGLTTIDDYLRSLRIPALRVNGHSHGRYMQSVRGLTFIQRAVAGHCRIDTASDAELASLPLVINIPTRRTASETVRTGIAQRLKVA